MSFSKMILNSAEVLRPVITKIVPAKMLSGIKARVINKEAKSIEKMEIIPFQHDISKRGINLVGSIRSDTGLGQSMRLVADLIEQSGTKYGIIDFFVPPGDDRTDHSHDSRIMDDFKYEINIFHVNTSEMPIAFMNLGKDKWDRHYNIAYWLWELEDFPEEWIPTFRLADEFWTPSEFISKTLRKYTDKPVVTVPYAVEAPVRDCFDRKYFGLPEDMFLYICIFNTGSGIYRKNPMAVVNAYKKAFPVEKENVGIVIKTNSAGEDDKELADVIKELGAYKNVYVLSKDMEKIEVNSLIKTCDVLVSLHRAEGFGLVMAEAMIVGTPVVATNWSANTEFMNDKVACMTDYKMTSIQKDIVSYKKGFKWAEADISDASCYMKKLYEDKAFYEDKKRSAAEYIKDKLDIKKSGSIINQRINDIVEGRK